VSTAVGEAGGSLLAQVLATSFAESGRETFMGGVSNVFKSAISNMIHTKTQVQSDISTKAEIQEQTQLMKDAIKAEEDKKAKRRALLQGIGATIALFISHVGGIAIGSIGYSVGMGVVIAYQGIINAKAFKSVLRQVHPHPEYVESDPDTVVNVGQFFETTQSSSISDKQAQYYRDKALAENALHRRLLEGGYNQRGVCFLPPDHPIHGRNYKKVTEAQEKSELLERASQNEENRPKLSLAAQMLVPLIDLIRNEKPGLTEIEYAAELGLKYRTFLEWTKRIQAMKDFNRDIKSDLYHDNFRKIRLAIKRNFPTASTSGQMTQLIDAYTQAFYGDENFWLGIIDIFDKYSTDRIVPIKTLSNALRRFTYYISSGLVTRADILRSNKYPGRFFDVLVRISLMEPSDLDLEDPNDLTEIQKECNQHIFKTVQNKFGVPDELQGRFDMLVDSLIAFTKNRRETSGDDKYTMQLTDLSEIVSSTGNRMLLRAQLIGRDGKSRILWNYRQTERIVIALRKEFFGAREESYKAITQLKIHMRDMNPRARRFRKYNINFKELKVPQMKELIDITLGLDPYAKEFLEDATIGKNRFSIPQIQMSMVRHHILEDPDYYLIFNLYEDIFFFELAPVSFKSNIEIHRSNIKNFDQNPDVIAARLMHLYELIQIPHTDGTDYQTVFENEFKKREAYIFGRGDTKIWNGIDPKIVAKYAERGVDWKSIGKSKSEQVVYNDYYPTFYNKGYKWFMNDFKLYLNEDPSTSYPEFWHWYSIVYLPQSIYPFLDSLKWNQI